jgi:hypothetical protein
MFNGFKTITLTKLGNIKLGFNFLIKHGTSCK